MIEFKLNLNIDELKEQCLLFPVSPGVKKAYVKSLLANGLKNIFIYEMVKN